MKIQKKRILTYVVGLIILALGIDLNTKTHLGVSPIISIAYNIATIKGWILGVTVFIYYVLQIFLQWFLLKKDFEYIQFMQAICALITSAAVQVFDLIIPSPNSMTLRLLLLILAIVITAIGASLTVSMKLIANPADALANVLGIKLGQDFGFGKNLLDLSCIVISLLICFICEGRLIGIGIGTIISMIFTGRVIAMLKGKTQKVYEWTLK